MKRLRIGAAGLVEFCRRRGSALMAGFIFSIFVFVVLGSLMPMVVNDYQSSVQNRLYNMAFAAAEAGADEVMWSLNHNRFDEKLWYEEGWQQGEDVYGNLYWAREIRLPQDDELGEDDVYAGQHQAVIRVVVGVPNPDADKHEYSVYSKADVTDRRTGRSATRIISFSAELPSPFRGLVVQNELSYNSLLDSYDSEDGPYGFPLTNKEREEAIVATTSDEEEILVSFGPQADIRGSVYSGDPGADNIDASKVKQITGGIHDGFAAEFPVISVPDTSDPIKWRSSF
ncbi:MAG: hypothetical protein ACQKBV_11895 [Puniceicoccales bacterium]